MTIIRRICVTWTKPSQASPPTSNNNKSANVNNYEACPPPFLFPPLPALASLLLPVTLLLRPRQLRLGIVYVFVSASLPAAVAVPVPVSVAALPLAACLCLPPSAAKCDIFARLISDRTCHSSTSRCVFRFLQHIPRQKGFAFVSA